MTESNNIALACRAPDPRRPVEPPAGVELLIDREVAWLLRVSRPRVWLLAKAGAFSTIKIGGRTVFRRSDVADYLTRSAKAAR